MIDGRWGQKRERECTRRRTGLRRFAAGGLAFLVMSFLLAGCTPPRREDGRLKVTATLFSQYDFAKQIGGEWVDVQLIVSAGMDSHSFEPTPSDMLDIQHSDVFLYNGGEMEYWVGEVLESMNPGPAVTVRMMDYVDVVEEESVEGMEIEKSHLHDGHSHVDGIEEDHDHEEEEEHFHESEDDHFHEIEYDEHIWTSPKNAMKMAVAIADALSQADPAHEADYKANLEAYLKKLEALDQEFREVVSQASRKIIIFGDKFPFRYFADEYGLEYRAAFPGCGTDTEPSIDTMLYLIDKVRQEQIPVVYYLELSSTKIARTISEETGAKALLLHSCHNVSKEDFKNQVTYLELMEQNVKNLREGLQ